MSSDDLAVRIYDYQENSLLFTPLGITEIPEPFGPPGWIRLNTIQMDKYSESGKITAIAHEFGHSLGLHHPPEGDDLMNAEVPNEFIPLTKNDKTSYDAAFKYYN